jgi:hypothetical protein
LEMSRPGRGEEQATRAVILRIARMGSQGIRM